MRLLKTLLLLSVLVVAGPGCDSIKIAMNRGNDEEDQKKPVKIVFPVETTVPHRGNISSYYETFTRVEAESKVDVLSEGMGKCIGLEVEEGDLVRKNQVLAELDKDEAQISLEQAQAQLKKAKDLYDKYEEEEPEDLVVFMTEQDLIEIEFNYEQAKINVKLQEEQLENLTIIAPIKGVITTRNIQLGQVVSTGAPVFSIVDPMSYILVIRPPEKLLSQLALKQVSAVTIDALPGEVFTI